MEYVLCQNGIKFNLSYNNKITKEIRQHFEKQNIKVCRMKLKQCLRGNL